MSLVFNGINTIDNVVFNGHNVEHIIYNGVEIWSAVNYSTTPMTFEILTSGTWKMTSSNTGTGATATQTAWSIEYSINGGSHVTTSGSARASKTIASGLVAGDIITIHSMTRKTYSSYYSKIDISGQFNVYGNLAVSMPTLETRGCASLFSGSTRLISCENLILHDTLTDSCYANMFFGCTNLTHPPTLPATTLANSCYHQMFYNCSNLLYAPELPATTLVSSCYAYLFYGCTKIDRIVCLATAGINSTNLNTWVYGVASIGTIVITIGSEWTTGYSGIPTNWVVIRQ